MARTKQTARKESAAQVRISLSPLPLPFLPFLPFPPVVAKSQRFNQTGHSCSGQGWPKENVLEFDTVDFLGITYFTTVWEAPAQDLYMFKHIQTAKIHRTVPFSSAIWNGRTCTKIVETCTLSHTRICIHACKNSKTCPTNARGPAAACGERSICAS
jgi:hypothetical protein